MSDEKNAPVDCGGLKYVEDERIEEVKALSQDVRNHGEFRRGLVVALSLLGLKL